MPESSQQRKTRLIYEKAARSAASWEQSKRSYPKRISGQQNLERVKAQLIRKQENRLRERIHFYNRLSLSPDQTPPIARIVLSSLGTCLGFFIIFLCVFVIAHLVATVVTQYLGSAVPQR
jgi:hypothetical protein